VRKDGREKDDITAKGRIRENRSGDQCGGGTKGELIETKKLLKRRLPRSKQNWSGRRKNKSMVNRAEKRSLKNSDWGGREENSESGRRGWKNLKGEVERKGTSSHSKESHSPKKHRRD